ERLIGNGAKQTPHLMANVEGDPVLVPPSAAKIAKDSPLDKDGKNGIGMGFKLIPKGTFTMGASKKDDKEATDDEKPHEVEITKDFYLGVFEVTQKQSKTITGYNPSHFSKDGEGQKGRKYDYNPPAGGKDTVKELDTDDFPVENVTYEEALEFLA